MILWFCDSNIFQCLGFGLVKKKLHSGLESDVSEIEMLQWKKKIELIHTQRSTLE